MSGDPSLTTPRPTFWRAAVVVTAALLTVVGGGLAIAASQTGPSSPPANFVGIQPVRVLDTRNAAGGPIGIAPGHKLETGESIDVAVGGVGVIPTNATSVAINITIDEDATLKSFLTVWPTGQPRPSTSANNAEPGLVSPNSAIFQLGAGGKLSVFNQQGAVNVIIDVTGYFIADEVVPTTTPTTPGQALLTVVSSLTDPWQTTGSLVSLTSDGVAFGPYADGGADGGSLVYNGLNGQPLSAVTALSYYMRYVSTLDTGGVGVPYLRVFTTGDTHDAIFSPNTQSPDPDIAEGPFHEWVATSGSWRYDDDPGNGPDMSFADLIAGHGTEVISGIRISTGNTAGTNLAALLRWIEINGQRFAFRG
jgi:hypothetical protein